jgi:propionyl-CoA synthetase
MGIEEFPVKPGSSTKPVPGFDVRILTASGKPVKSGEEGLVAIKLPLPPGTLPTLWQAEERFLQSYMELLPGYYFTSDGGYIDDEGYVFIMGRVDDVINVAGHRLSTGEMEEILATHRDVAECAVFGVEDQLKGQVPVGLVVLKSGAEKDEETLKQDLARMIREEIGAIANFKQSAIVKRLPKTRSGKILRGTMRKIADSREFTMPSTIDDPVILDEIREALKKIGYAR